VLGVDPDHSHEAVLVQLDGTPPTMAGFIPSYAEKLAGICNALVETSAVFAKTLLLITYDEHGGFYDHVPAENRAAEHRCRRVRLRDHGCAGAGGRGLPADPERHRGHGVL
jgi:phospholipase C